MARFSISNNPSGRMIVSLPYGSFRVAKVKTAERSGENFLVAVDLITNNVDVAAGVVLGRRFKMVAAGENEGVLKYSLFVQCAGRRGRK
jgi:hypothetical protein